MKLILFDDERAGAWSPFSLTRPGGELMFGSRLIRARLESLAGVRAAAAISRPWLKDFAESGAPVTNPGTVEGPDEQARLFLSTRAVPAPGAILEIDESRPCDIRVGDEVAGRLVPGGAAAPDAAWLAQPGASSADSRESRLQGRMVENVWDLIAGNREQLQLDLAREASREWDRPDASATVIGDGRVLLAADVVLEPGVVFDTRDGHILLDGQVEVRSGSRLAGPLYAGPGTRLLGGSFSALSAGPVCTLRGEISDTVVLGYSNKAHDGFLGDAYLGRWVNLGAMTTNSNLKSNYGPIRLGALDGAVDTGLSRLGCLLGDHVKTAIGTLLNTGTRVGAGASLFGQGMPPKYVPPFSWGGRPESATCRLDAFLSTARIVFGRRDVPFDDGVERWLSAAWTAADTGESS